MTRERCGAKYDMKMVIIAITENGQKADWMDGEDLELNGITRERRTASYPTYSTTEHFAQIWGN